MIYVITHKIFDDSKLDRKTYKILHVGHGDNSKKYYLRDDCGDNISCMNSRFCEMTGLYWIWKNACEKDDDICGIVHYRRFFINSEQNFLTSSEAEELCQDNTIIVPNAFFTPMSLKKEFIHFHDKKVLNVTENILSQMYPESIKVFHRVLKCHKAFYFNMFICKKKTLDCYCNWIFPLLFTIDEHIPKDYYTDQYQERMIGFLAERLFNVWLLQYGYKYVELPVINTEDGMIVKFHIRTIKERITDLFEKK